MTEVTTVLHMDAQGRMTIPGPARKELGLEDPNTGDIQSARVHVTIEYNE